MANVKGSLYLALIGTILYLLIFLGQPIYERLWLQLITTYLPAMTTQYLGLLFLTLGFICLGLFFATKKKESYRRNALFIAFVFFIIVSIPYIFPTWFYSYWRF